MLPCSDKKEVFLFSPICLKSINKCSLIEKKHLFLPENTFSHICSLWLSVFFLQVTASVLTGHDSICKRPLKWDSRITNVQVVFSERETEWCFPCFPLRRRLHNGTGQAYNRTAHQVSRQCECYFAFWNLILTWLSLQFVRWAITKPPNGICHLWCMLHFTQYRNNLLSCRVIDSSAGELWYAWGSWNEVVCPPVRKGWVRHPCLRYYSGKCRTTQHEINSFILTKTEWEVKVKLMNLSFK